MDRLPGSRLATTRRSSRGEYFRPRLPHRQARKLRLTLSEPLASTLSDIIGIRLWQQERAIQGNDEKLIDWSVIPCDELPFAQNELSKAWSRLKRKYLTTAEAQSQPLKREQCFVCRVTLTDTPVVESADFS